MALHRNSGSSRMRLLLWAAVAVTPLAIAGRAVAANAPAMRAPTRIPAEPLGLALRALASGRGFQVVYVSGQVDHQRTRGASGDLTIDEALTQVLRGTGFTYRKISDTGIAIEPIASQRKPALPHPPVAPSAPSATRQSNDGSAATAPAQLGQVTIATSEERRALRRRVDHFVTSAVVQPSNDALFRWNVPVCPLVAGLPEAWGELILERISKAAVDAHAPLAGRVCHPNLYVVGHDDVGRLLKEWWARDRQLYDFAHVGIEAVEHFNDSRRTIRAWYNTRWEGPDSAACGPADSAPFLGSGVSGTFDAQTCTDGTDTRLTYGSTGSNIFSAIVVVDMNRMKGMTIQQLGDYVALIGLADVRLDADPPVPSILELFHDGTPPRGLTRWDKALLYSLYNTGHSDKLQVSEMESAMVKRIAP
jgi:Secretin and TonB N terminus short domain